MRLGALEDRTLLATFTVNSLNDADDGICAAGHCSLREAGTAANAAAGADMIDFSVTGTITLGSGDQPGPHDQRGLASAIARRLS